MSELEPTPVRRWTGEQAAAIQASEHTLLAASAGTGKTTTVIGKILWHLGFDVGLNDATGAPIPECPPELRHSLDQIAAITFTEKAAYDLKKELRDELRRRDRALVWELDRAAIGTIHGFCGDLLREHALRLGIDPTFRVLDEREARVEQDAIIREVVMGALQTDESDGGPDPDLVELVQRYGVDRLGKRDGTVDYVREAMRDLRWHPERYAAFVSGDALDLGRLREAAAAWTDGDELADRFCAILYRLAREARARWLDFEERENVRDFDSLILHARRLVTDGSGAGAALAGLRRRFRLLIIDEFQDTDAAQWEIAAAIAGLEGNRIEEGERAPQLFLVGDPKQSIYRFRGADIAVWNRAREAICADEPAALTHNFRSDPEVVSYVNRACRSVLEEVRDELAEELPESRIDYAELEPARGAVDVAEVEWLEAPEKPAADRRDREAKLVAARIRDIVFDEERGDTNGIHIVDPDSPPDAPKFVKCRYRHVAILFRSRTGIEHYEQALRQYGVPYYLTGDAGFNERQEILDCLTVLRLLEDTGDDLRAFAYLRSPFVGLRDEVIARMRLEGQGGTLLRQARDFLEHDEWFPAPEDPRIVEIEKAALATGLDTIEEISALRSRLPLDQLLEEVLDRTGYRLHLWFTEAPEPVLANIQRFVQLLEGYRDHTVGTFLEIWDRWKEKALGIPQAPLYSAEDDVVTLSTIHSAKGLEWPIVFLIDSHDIRRDYLVNSFWSDRKYGPVLCLKADDRGERGNLLHRRATLEETAEAARIVYVAATRARDRLILAGPTDGPLGDCEWLYRGWPEDGEPTTEPPDVDIPLALPEPALDWLDDVTPAPAPSPLIQPVRRPRIRFMRSASELMAWQRSRMEWRLKYWHGVEPWWYFARESVSENELPGWVRGTLIHGVLEKIEHEREIAELLDETIGALDSPELEERLAAGSEYRDELEREIERVVGSDEWKWYVDGEHYRELPFVHLVTDRKWRIGALDLYRPRPDQSWIIDFKTHDIGPDDVDRVSRDYGLQVAVYTAAVDQLALTGEIRMRLHFTRPNRTVDSG